MDGGIVTATEAGRSLPRLLNRLSSEEGTYFITDSQGCARAVLLDINKYHAMMDALEDEETGGPDAAVAGALLRAILQRARKG